MNSINFKYKAHPSDFLRNTGIIMLPNPEEDLESFLIQFLNHYQSDERVTFLDDLYKLIDDEFYSNEDKANFIKIIGNKSEQEIREEILEIENELKNEAYTNFYNLVLTQKIEILGNGEK